MNEIGWQCNTSSYESNVLKRGFTYQSQVDLYKYANTNTMVEFCIQSINVHSEPTQNQKRQYYRHESNKNGESNDEQICLNEIPPLLKVGWDLYCFLLICDTLGEVLTYSILFNLHCQLHFNAYVCLVRFEA